MNSPDQQTWRKSSYSNGSGGDCVEVAYSPDRVAVRDSKHTDRMILITPTAWREFVFATRG
jgi:hypothetical protein